MLTENGPVDNVCVGKPDLDRMLLVLDHFNDARNGRVGERDVTVVVEDNLTKYECQENQNKIINHSYLECKGPVVSDVSSGSRIVPALQGHVAPLDDERGPVVGVPDLCALVLTRVEVRHERRDILRRGEPRVHVLPRVEEPPGGDGDVLHLVSVEGEGKAELDGGGPPVRLGQHGVLLDDALRGVQAVQVDPGVLVGRLDALVVLVRQLLRHVVLLVLVALDRLVDLPLGHVHVAEDLADELAPHVAPLAAPVVVVPVLRGLDGGRGERGDVLDGVLGEPPRPEQRLLLQGHEFVLLRFRVGGRDRHDHDDE